MHKATHASMSGGFITDYAGGARSVFHGKEPWTKPHWLQRRVWPEMPW
jgi:hypothetical protein